MCQRHRGPERAQNCLLASREPSAPGSLCCLVLSLRPQTRQRQTALTSDCWGGSDTNGRGGLDDDTKMVFSPTLTMRKTFLHCNIPNTGDFPLMDFVVSPQKVGT